MPPELISLLEKIEHASKDLVWYSASQIARNEHLVNDETKGERPWIIPRTTGAFLHEQILKHAPRIALELGTSIGYSTLWIADAIKNFDGHVHTLEKNPEKINLAKNYAHEAGLEKYITFHEGHISNILQNLPALLHDQEIDFLFMDADRGHYHEYFPLVEKHLSKNAIIIADNAVNMQSRMQPFLQLLIDSHWNYEILDFDNGILVAYRSGGTS